MLKFIYDLGVRLYGISILIASIWLKKAKLWIHGRTNWKQNLKDNIEKLSNPVWFHAASSGEFEQAKPIIEWIKENYPTQKILVTFFSPSGYELSKKYSLADLITYLPLDTPQNAKDFLTITQPKMAIFIKYEFWLNFLFEIQKRKIPCFLVCGIFRENSPFFKGILKTLFQRALNAYNQIFVQDKLSFELLKNVFDTAKITVAGDTRFDRVIKIQKNWKPVIEVEKYLPPKPILMLGSSWYPDEIWLKKIIPLLPEWHFVIVPHEISAEHNQKLKKIFLEAVFFSELENNEPSKYKILIIDKMGWLSRLYNYADAVWIGGGFGKGIHNTLEAAVYGKPIFFGPNYKKFHEAFGLIEYGAAFPVHANTSPTEIVHFLRENIQHASHSAKKYVIENQGSTEKIVKYLKNYL